MWVEELKNGKYKYVERYTDELTGKVRKVSLTRTKRNARVEKEMTQRLLAKIAEKQQRNVIEEITFGELADEWLKIYKQEVKHSSYKIAGYTLSSVLNQFKDIPIKKLTPAHFNKFFIERKEQGITTRSLSTQKSLIKRLFKHAVLFGYLKDNPLTDKLHVPKSNAPTNDFKYLERDELQALIDHLYKQGRDEYARFTLLMANLGTRFGELVSIRYEDIDYTMTSNTLSPPINAICCSTIPI